MKVQLIQGLITVFTAFILLFSFNKKDEIIHEGVEVDVEIKTLEQVEQEFYQEIESLNNEIEIAEAYRNAITTQQVSQEKKFFPDPIEIYPYDD